MAWFSAQAAGNQQGAESRHTSHGNDTVQNGGSGNFGGSGAPHTPREEASADQRAIVLPMPKLSHSMTHGRVLKWHVSEGSPVAVYDVIATVETETLVEEAYRLDQFAGKVSLLVESQEEGFVARLLAAEGEEVPVGRPIALLCEDADEVQAVSGGADCWLQRVRDVYSSDLTRTRGFGEGSAGAGGAAVGGRGGHARA
ncbi:hypothetical protein PLESTM_000072600 [Pleodorina starrii]|nr:hypothetical protein PLESTM_000072600 [Pleodorina starrii]